MIYLADIQTVDDLARADQEYNENCAFLEEMDAEIFLIKSQSQSLKMFDMYTEDVQERTGNIIIETCRKIGQKILDIIRSITDFLSGIVSKWKSDAWGSKSDMEKIEQLSRKNPKAAEQIKIAVSKGELDFMSYSDFSDFYKHIDEIIDGINAKNANEKTLRGKWEKVKRKYCTDAKFRTVATIVGVVGTATTTYVLWKRFKNESSTWDIDKLKKIIDTTLQHVKLKTEELTQALTAQKIKGEKLNNKLNKNKVNRMHIDNAAADTRYEKERHEAASAMYKHIADEMNHNRMSQLRDIGKMQNAVDDFNTDNLGRNIMDLEKLICEMMNEVNKVNKDQIIHMGRLKKRVTDAVINQLSSDTSFAWTQDKDVVINAVANATKAALDIEKGRVNNAFAH